MPPRRTVQQCREKIREMISEAVVEDDDARREGLLKMADQWIDVAERRKAEAARPTARRR